MTRIARSASAIAMLACVCFIGGSTLAKPTDDKPKQKKTKKTEPDKINPYGEPKFDQGKHTGYYLWYDDGMWHLRMTAGQGKKGKKAKEVFTGSIHIENGSILKAQGQGLERAKKAEDADWVVLRQNMKGIDFRIANFGKTDGFDFKVSDLARSITFKPLIGGGEHPQRIAIGAKGQHPDKVPFELPAHPEK